MNITTKLQPLNNPFSHEEKTGSVGAPAPMNNMYGFNSIQDFSGVFGNHNSDLSQTLKILETERQRSEDF
jgi:hypothetical protein